MRVDDNGIVDGNDIGDELADNPLTNTTAIITMRPTAQLTVAVSVGLKRVFLLINRVFKTRVFKTRVYKFRI